MNVARVALTDANQQTLIAAPTGGASIYVYMITGSNSGASLSTVDLKDGTTAKFSYAMAALGGGFGQPLGVKPWKLAAGAALNVQQSAAVASYVSVIYEVF